MGMIPAKKLDYSDGRTDQGFKGSTDINRLLAKAARSGTLSHLDQYQGNYGDFSGFDFMETQNKIARGTQIFEALPSEVRREFNQSPQEFFEFANDPNNRDRLRELLPELAKPGTQMPKIRAGAQKTPAGVASEPQASETNAPAPATAESSETRAEGE